MKKYLNTILAIFIITSCNSVSKKNESRPTLDSIKTKVELPVTPVKPIKKETPSGSSLIFNAWATDRRSPHADFLITEDAFGTVEDFYSYELIGDTIKVQYEEFSQLGVIKKLTTDTLIIKWNGIESDFTYLDYRNGYDYTRDQLISIIEFYSSNYGTSRVSHDYVDNQLNPALYTLAEMFAYDSDEELFELFLEMILKSKGSANETPSDILAYIYICNQDLVLSRLNNQYKNDYLTELLEFGFENSTQGEENFMENYERLKAGIDSLVKK